MRVRIEFELDVNDSQKRIVGVWLEKVTKSIRTSRFLVPGSWRINF